MTIFETLQQLSGAMTTKEVSSLLNLHPVTIRDWVRAGRIPAHYVSNQLRFDPQELAAWWNKRSVGNTY